MKKIVIFSSIVVIAFASLTAAPVRNHHAARCIKRYMETHYPQKYQNVRIGCKRGMPTASFWDRRYRKRRGVLAFTGSLGKKLKKACANPCR
jgi:hypothetical protein